MSTPESSKDEILAQYIEYCADKDGDLTKAEAKKLMQYMWVVTHRGMIPEKSILTAICLMCNALGKSSTDANLHCSTIASLLKRKVVFFTVMCYYFVAMKAPSLGIKCLTDTYKENGGDIALVINRAEYETEIMIMNTSDVVNATENLLAKFPLSDGFKTREDLKSYVRFADMEIARLRPLVSGKAAVACALLPLGLNCVKATMLMSERVNKDSGQYQESFELALQDVFGAGQDSMETPSGQFKFIAISVFYSSPMELTMLMDTILGEEGNKEYTQQSDRTAS